MAPSRGVSLAIAALLAFAVGVAVVGATAPVDPSMSQTATTDLQPSNTTMWVQLQSDGDARWTVTMAVDLDDKQRRDAFNEIADRFEAGESDLLSIGTFRQFAALSSQATGRQMALENISHEATVGDRTGELALSFTWTSFSRRDDGRLRVGDAFDAPGGGTWLKGLDADQRLVIEAPDTFSIAETPSGITIVNETIRWAGPTQFDPSYISITYTAETPTPVTPTDRSPTATTDSTPTQEADSGSVTTVTPGNGGDLPLAGIGVFAFVALVALVYAVRSVSSEAENADNGDAGDGEHASGDATEDGDDGATDTGDASASPTPTDTAQPAAGATDADDAEPAPIDRELLSDEEYVEALIERNGGRMKQADIVSETGWSNAKVSQLLSAMAEDGRIEKLRIGRENLISFPDDEGEP